MILTEYINTFGHAMQKKYGERVHKISIDAEFTCPNRDGSKGRGGCTFCNNNSFSPNSRQSESVSRQIMAGKQVIKKRTGANKYLAYFQAYTNTYADIRVLQDLYDEALSVPDVVGLSIGTRPDCLPYPVLELIASYKQQGYEVWLELGLQSSFDATLARVNRGHGFAEYRDAVKAARALGIPVCTHLILGLPGEHGYHYHKTLQRVLQLGLEGLKLHPLHIVKGTQLANQWRRGEYQPITEHHYVNSVADLIEHTPTDIIFHRITGTASRSILLEPGWCSKKWQVLNAIAQTLRTRGSYQGSALTGDELCKFH